MYLLIKVLENEQHLKLAKYKCIKDHTDVDACGTLRLMVMCTLILSNAALSL